LDAGVTPEGEPYILMEFLEGDSLQKLLQQQGRMPVSMVQEIARQAGSALSAAHAAGIVHRDLKPENIFLMPDPVSSMGFRVKVLDFGIAKVRLGGAWGSTLKTQAGQVMGSPAYMSPEQCRDSSDVDRRSDIYSLAVIVYEMLAGMPLFASSSTTAMLVLQLTASPVPLRSVVPDVDEYIEQAVMRALSKEREQRYDSVDYFVGALLGTYPAFTAMGSAAFAGKESAGPTSTAPYSAAPRGIQQTLSPAAVPTRATDTGLAPETVTTLSRATGESELAPEDASIDAEWESVRSKRWPIFAVFGAVVVGLALFLVLRPSGSPAPVAAARPAIPENAAVAAPSPAASALVHVRISSSPAGATIVDSKDGSVLGQTPLEKTYPQGKGVVAMVVRMAGYQDKNVAIGLDGDSSTSVALEANDTVRAEVASKPAAIHAEHPSDVGARKTPPKPKQRKEDAWRVH